MNDRILEVKNLKKHFPVRERMFKRETRFVKAVDGVSFAIRRGETLGLVGESGCGKSTAARTIIRLYDLTGGDVIFDGKSIGYLKEHDLKPYRKRIQMIFQDPYTSLNCRMTVGDIIGEPLQVHHICPVQDRRDVIHSLLDRVGLKHEHSSRYPHEFSGGQRQRIGIARALAVNPEFIICDEPISALDVSIQAQIVNMMQDLQQESGLTYLFIAHDLSMVKHISKKMGVMYLGKLVELADSKEVYEHPAHPYTKALLSVIPVPNPRLSAEKEGVLLEGEIPSPIDPPAGCHFVTRCAYAMGRCKEIEPELKDIGNEHMVACHLL